MKISACAITGSAWPTSIVPGMSSSGTRRSNRNAAVVVANEPMPSVSKKLVTKPISRSTPSGRPGATAAVVVVDRNHPAISSDAADDQHSEQHLDDWHAGV